MVLVDYIFFIFFLHAPILLATHYVSPGVRKSYFQNLISVKY
jgi:hypothetical protein